MDRLFFDTNILLDILEERYPHVADSLDCLNQVRTNRIPAAISALSLSDIAYIQRGQPAATLYDAFGQLRTYFVIAPLDQSCVDATLKRRLPDFEDALQWECALSWKATHLLTRNVGDFPANHRKLKALSPYEYLHSIRKHG